MSIPFGCGSELWLATRGEKFHASEKVKKAAAKNSSSLLGVRRRGKAGVGGLRFIGVSFEVGVPAGDQARRASWDIAAAWPARE
jgi:hypothetical protein